MASQAAERMAEVIQEIIITEGVIIGAALNGADYQDEREYYNNLVKERNELEERLKQEAM